MTTNLPAAFGFRQSFQILPQNAHGFWAVSDLSDVQFLSGTPSSDCEERVVSGTLDFGFIGELDPIGDVGWATRRALNDADPSCTIYGIARTHIVDAARTSWREDECVSGKALVDDDDVGGEDGPPAVLFGLGESSHFGLEAGDLELHPRSVLVTGGADPDVDAEIGEPVGGLVEQ